LDYPQLNLLFGFALILAIVVNSGLHSLLLKAGLSIWLSRLSWIALVVSLLSALFIEMLFLRLMTPAFNLQIGLGLLIIGGIAAFIFANLYRCVSTARFTRLLFAAQMLVSLVSLNLAFGLFRNLMPVPTP